MELDQIITALDIIATRLKEHEEALKTQREALQEFSSEYRKTLETAFEKLRDLDERFIRMEHDTEMLKKSNRPVLILHNMELNERENLKQTTRSLLNFHLRVELSPQDIIFARKLGSGEKGPIKIVFNSTDATLKVTSTMCLFKGTRYNVSEEYDTKTRELRKKLIPLLFKARQEGKFAILRNSDLFIDGKKFIVPDTTFLDESSSSNETSSSPERKESVLHTPPASPATRNRKSKRKKTKKKH